MSDPRTHPDWWPELVDVQLFGELAEGGEYTRVTRRLGFLDLVDGVWVAERLDHLKEAHFRCTVSGAYTRFALTPARGDTFVEIETGIVPTGRRWQAAKAVGGPALRRWARALLEALPRAVARGEPATSGPVRRSAR